MSRIPAGHRSCLMCGDPFPAIRTSPRWYCSRACRQRAYRLRKSTWDLHDLHPQPGDPAGPLPAGVEGFAVGGRA